MKLGFRGLAVTAFLLMNSSFSCAANFVPVSKHGNEVETSSIKKSGDLAYYVIRRARQSWTQDAINVIANCATRQRAEKANRPGVSTNNGQFVPVGSGTSYSEELDFVCGDHAYHPPSRPVGKSEARRATLALLNAQTNALMWGPQRTVVTPRSGGEPGIYYQLARKKIEEVGTRNFPQSDGKQLYGSTILSIPIFQDGTIYGKEGGPQVEKSSGIEALDKAALDIVYKAAPFGRLPENMLRADKEVLWILVSRFTFTREETGAPSIFMEQKQARNEGQRLD